MGQFYELKKINIKNFCKKFDDIIWCFGENIFTIIIYYKYLKLA